jgi:uncharacterized protein YceK
MTINNFVIALSIALVAPGCAAVLKTKDAPVTVSSATPGSEILVDGQHAGVTPATLHLATTSDHVITVRGAGKEETCHLEGSASAGWIVLDVLVTGGVGLIVDFVTHDWNNLDKSACAVGL